ncbi:MAG: BolA family transcriptional regulator [Gammaproteobacteria bacterium]|nr:BolA family transcriptional regulator [Gammaproteobacteria bacterium]
MTVREDIENKLVSDLDLDYVEVVNESRFHNVPENSETHFKVTLISSQFQGRRLIERHRAVNKVLTEELSGPVHALAIHTYTPEEWLLKNQRIPDSPACLGGKASEST